jgi:hypothetical protein
MSDEPGSLDGIALGFGLDNRAFESRQRLGNLLFTTASRLALEPNQSHVQWESGALSLVVKLTTYLHLVPRLRMFGAIPPLPHYALKAWRLVK